VWQTEDGQLRGTVSRTEITEFVAWTMAVFLDTTTATTITIATSWAR